MAQVKQNPTQITAPRWAAEFLSPDKLIPGGAKLLAAEFLAPDGVRVTVAAPGAAEGAVAIPVVALTGAIPAGIVIPFGVGVYARLTAAAAAGAVALAVEALPAAVVTGSVGSYAGILPKTIPSGIPVGRTLVERNAGTPFGAAVAADDELFLIAFDVTDATMNNDVELVKHGLVVKENYLPGFATWPADLVARVRELYQCTRGTD